jgi:hypothetical protein
MSCNNDPIKQDLPLTGKDRALIVATNNGYIIYTWSGWAEDQPEIEVIEEVGNELADQQNLTKETGMTPPVRALYNLAWSIINRYDSTNRYAKQRVVAKVVPGDKCEDASPEEREAAENEGGR